MKTDRPAQRTRKRGSLPARLRKWITAARVPGNGKWRQRLLLLSLVGVSVTLVLALRFLAPATAGIALSLDQVSHMGAGGQVLTAQLLDEDAELTGTYCTAPLVRGQCNAPTADFHSFYPRSDIATEQLINDLKQHATVTVDRQSDKATVRLLTQFLLPLVLLANLFALAFAGRGGSSSIGEVVGFGKMRRGGRRVSTGVTFDDVAGSEMAVAELREVVEYLTDPERFEAYGARPPKGVLLFGPPGCGKTLLARAVAGESGVPFFSIAGAEFVESLVGVGAARVRDLFRQVRLAAPAIVFIDEIDAVGRRRGGGDGGSGGEREQTLNQLLVEMDGFEVTSGIVVMGATNRPDILDPALMRPGRFDRHVTVEQPDYEGRRAILQLHGRGKPIETGVTFDALARRTPGFTGADLANVINEAALLAIREERTEVNLAHLSEAVERVRHGPSRRGHLMQPEERARVAYHEAGHAIAAAVFGHSGEIERLSIVARGRGQGHAVVTGGDRVLATRSQLLSHITMAMAGPAAEELVLGEASTGGESDIERATDVARQVVGRFGMSARVGRIRLYTSDSNSYLGGDYTLSQGLGDSATVFAEEVRRLVDSAHDEATALLVHNRDQLDRLAARLEHAETLEGDELTGLLEAVGRPVAASQRAIRSATRPRARRPAEESA
ncbi:MAG: ATP-dependent zinc metalloprotease FtsH [Candidatus Dormibacteria bacterium]